MTSQSPLVHASVLLLLHLLLTLAPTFLVHAVAKELPASVILEQKNDAQQVLLIRTTDSGTAVDVLLTECGAADTFYATSAVVLGVNRTVTPDATALGAETTGRVMERCDALRFKTFDRDVEECDALSAPPGRKVEGTCGYVYLTPGMEAKDPYSLAVTGRGGFDEVDGSVCDDAAREYCPAYVVEEEEEEEGGDGIGGDSGAASGGDVAVDAGAEEGDDGEGVKSGARDARRVRRFVAISLLSAVALLGDWGRA